MKTKNCGHIGFYCGATRFYKYTENYIYNFAIQYFVFYY